MTLEEIIESVEAYKNRQEYRLKERALMDYKLAQCISDNIASLLDKKNKAPEFFNVYSELFEKESKELEKQKTENEIEINKQRMRDFANFHNKNLKGKEE